MICKLDNIIDHLKISILAIADRIEIGKSFWFGGSSYAKYNFVNRFPIRKTYELSIRLRIRTTEPDGLILWIGRLLMKPRFPLAFTGLVLITCFRTWCWCFQWSQIKRISFTYFGSSFRYAWANLWSWNNKTGTLIRLNPVDLTIRRTDGPSSLLGIETVLLSVHNPNYFNGFLWLQFDQLKNRNRRQ